MRRRKPASKFDEKNENNGIVELAGGDHKNAELEGDHKHAQELGEDGVEVLERDVEVGGDGLKRSQNQQRVPRLLEELDGTELKNNLELEGDLQRPRELMYSHSPATGKASERQPENDFTLAQQDIQNSTPGFTDIVKAKDVIVPESRPREASPKHTASATITSPLSSYLNPEADEEMRWLEREEQRIAARKQELLKQSGV